jgi:hypothetical protein
MGKMTYFALTLLKMSKTVFGVMALLLIVSLALLPRISVAVFQREAEKRSETWTGRSSCPKS